MFLKHQSLSRKILILVLSPIIIESIFLGGLGWLLHTAEQQLAQEVRLNTINSSVDNLVRHLYLSGTSLLAYITTNNDDAFKSHKAHRKQANQELNAICSLTAHDPHESALAAKVKALTLEIEQIFDETTADNKVGGWLFMKTHKLNKQMQTLSADLFSETDRLKELEESKLREHPGRAQQTRELIKALIWVAAAVNLMLACLVASMISKDMVRRLRSLMENARRISVQEPLLEPIAGDDEISRLDRTLHLAAEELSFADKKRKEAEKEKNEFISMVAHDLKTPLTVVQASLAELTQGSASNIESSRLIDTAREVERLVNLTEDLIDVSLIDSSGFNIELKPVETWILVEQAIRAVSPAAAQRNIEIVRPGNEALVKCDRERIVQVLVNLLINALQASPSGSQVKFEVIEKDTHVLVSLHDHGCGIPDELKSEVFEAHKSFRKEGQGTGLGLAICQAIIAGHSQNIGVRDAEGGGCCFWFTLASAKQE